jgi:hypothetical protein
LGWRVLAVGMWWVMTEVESVEVMRWAYRIGQWMAWVRAEESIYDSLFYLNWGMENNTKYDPTKDRMCDNFPQNWSGLNCGTRHTQIKMAHLLIWQDLPFELSKNFPHLWGQLNWYIYIFMLLL